MTEWAYSNYATLILRCRTAGGPSPTPRHTAPTASRPPFAGLPAAGLGGWEIEVCDQTVLADPIVGALDGLAEGIWVLFDSDHQIVGGFTPPEELVWRERTAASPDERHERFRGSRRHWRRNRD